MTEHTSVEQLNAANLGGNILGKDLVGGGLDLDLAVVRHVDLNLAIWRSGVLAIRLGVVEGRR